jgi:hypothetical protein
MLFSKRLGALQAVTSVDDFTDGWLFLCLVSDEDLRQFHIRSRSQD